MRLLCCALVVLLPLGLAACGSDTKTVVERTVTERTVTKTEPQTVTETTPTTPGTSTVQCSDAASSHNLTGGASATGVSCDEADQVIAAYINACRFRDGACQAGGFSCQTNRQELYASARCSSAAGVVKFATGE